MEAQWPAHAWYTHREKQGRRQHTHPPHPSPPSQRTYLPPSFPAVRLGRNDDDEALCGGGEWGWRVGEWGG